MFVGILFYFGDYFEVILMLVDSICLSNIDVFDFIGSGVVGKCCGIWRECVYYLF